MLAQPTDVSDSGSNSREKVSKQQDLTDIRVTLHTRPKSRTEYWSKEEYMIPEGKFRNNRREEEMVTSIVTYEVMTETHF